MTPLYSAADVVTIIAAIGVLIAGVSSAVVSVIVALRNGTKTDNVGLIAQAGLDNSRAVSTKIDEVHALTNSNLTEVKNQLIQMMAQNAALTETIHFLKLERERIVTTQALITQPPRSGGRASDAAIPPIGMTAPPVTIVSPEVHIAAPPTEPEIISEEREPRG